MRVTVSTIVVLGLHLQQHVFTASSIIDDDVAFALGYKHAGCGCFAATGGAVSCGFAHGNRKFKLK